MQTSSGAELTDRQRGELEYHKQHAAENLRVLSEPFSRAVLECPQARWWNAYWQMYVLLSRHGLRGKKVLVIGCGFGDDALRAAMLGAEVYAFDLSPDSLAIARSLAEREGLSIQFDEMPAEALTYADNTFDVILARDILHHVDIPLAVAEIRRVAKRGAMFVVNEIYSHSITEVIRRSAIVDKFIYPKMQRVIYGPGKPYITQDERKLSEDDIRLIHSIVPKRVSQKYFNFLVTRILPENAVLARFDRVLMMVLRPVEHLLAGRTLFSGHIDK